MQQRQLGQTGLSVSSIGLGCVTFGREIDRRTAMEILDYAAKCGISLLDTAAAYGDGASEEILGEWLSGCGLRNRPVVMTKVAPPLMPKNVVTSVAASLRRLRLDRLDVLLLHQPDPVAPIEPTLEVLDQLVRKGKVRHLGCSNFSAAQLRTVLEIQARRGLAHMAVVQPIYNLVHREIEADLLPLCSQEGLGVVTYSPLGAGFLTGKYTPGGPIPAGTRFDIKPGHQDIYFSENGFRVLADLRAESERTGTSIIQLALAWVFRQPGIASVLVGARTPAHIDQALAAAEIRR